MRTPTSTDRAFSSPLRRGLPALLALMCAVALAGCGGGESQAGASASGQGASGTEGSAEAATQAGANSTPAPSTTQGNAAQEQALAAASLTVDAKKRPRARAAGHATTSHRARPRAGRRAAPAPVSACRQHSGSGRTGSQRAPGAGRSPPSPSPLRPAGGHKLSAGCHSSACRGRRAAPGYRPEAKTPEAPET